MKKDYFFSWKKSGIEKFFCFFSEKETGNFGRGGTKYKRERNFFDMDGVFEISSFQREEVSVSLEVVKEFWNLFEICSFLSEEMKGFFGGGRMKR